MQAKSSLLSQDQIFALRSTFTFLKAVTTYLEIHASALLDLGVMCMAKLVESVKECADGPFSFPGLLFQFTRGRRLLQFEVWNY
jgi:hypothetical protein